MGILCIMLSVLLGFVSFITFASATAIPAQLLAGELAICASVLFAAGAVCNSVDKIRSANEPKKADIPAS
jgi:hypothetical protein